MTSLVVHGHFYQPPRENPWLEAVEVQDSAAPFHDWNERITAECYAPNTAARRVLLASSTSTRCLCVGTSSRARLATTTTWRPATCPMPVTIWLICRKARNAPAAF